MTAATPAPRRAGRPPRSVLSRDRITAAALELVADTGYAGLTMSALARRLRVAPSALYNHAGSKQEVLGWIQEHVMTMVDFSAFAEEPWDEALRSWAWSYREVFARHTPLIPVIAVLPVTDAEKTLRMYEEVTLGLTRAGWPPERVVPVIVALESFVYGSALDVTAPGDIFDPGALADRFPSFTTAARLAAAPTADESPADTAFRTGLDGLIDGLRLQLGAWLRAPGEDR